MSGTTYISDRGERLLISPYILTVAWWDYISNLAWQKFYHHSLFKCHKPLSIIKLITYVDFVYTEFILVCVGSYKPIDTLFNLFLEPTNTEYVKFLVQGNNLPLNGFEPMQLCKFQYCVHYKSSSAREVTHKTQDNDFLIQLQWYDTKDINNDKVLKLCKSSVA
jgi:hypothetical protein